MGYSIHHSKAQLLIHRKRIYEDNAEGKGHHRHFGDAETPLEFESLDSLVRRFLDEVSRLRGRPQ